jgi:hypothetical protein
MLIYYFNMILDIIVEVFYNRIFSFFLIINFGLMRLFFVFLFMVAIHIFIINSFYLGLKNLMQNMIIIFYLLFYLFLLCIISY